METVDFVFIPENNFLIISSDLITYVVCEIRVNSKKKTSYMMHAYSFDPPFFAGDG